MIKLRKLLRIFLMEMKWSTNNDIPDEFVSGAIDNRVIRPIYPLRRIVNNKIDE